MLNSRLHEQPYEERDNRLKKKEEKTKMLLIDDIKGRGTCMRQKIVHVKE